jgi:hypothetical protein
MSNSAGCDEDTCSAMRCVVFQASVLAAMLLGLPAIGMVLAGKALSPYLAFPPKHINVGHAPFSWLAFLAYSLIILGMVSLLAVRAFGALRHRPLKRSGSSHRRPFPWWGWLGIMTGMTAWFFAWTRFSWLKPFQPYTFTPLWLSLILVVNALTYRATARCMLLDRPRFFMLLFPLSAGFWWFFEYLNRFVQNWYYVGVHLGGWEYFWVATLSFSTVLPAVLGTRDWLYGASWLDEGFKDFITVSTPKPKVWAWSVLLLSSAGLAGIGIWPNFLFALLWVSPLLIVVSIQSLLGEPHVLSGIGRGDWRPILAAALAALICGVFWEMWNEYSLSKWQYDIPFVNRFRVFEMPVLGYAGYLPFGLECALIGGMLERLAARDRGL